MLKNLDDVGKHTWASEIKLLLYRYGFGYVWVSQSVGNIEVFLSLLKQRLGDTYLQEWHTELSNNGKLEMYRPCIFSVFWKNFIFV